VKRSVSRILYTPSGSNRNRRRRNDKKEFVRTKNFFPFIMGHLMTLSVTKLQSVVGFKVLAAQGEAGHRKYKRLKLGGGQAYDRSSH
jgi:hypothetical protein